MALTGKKQLFADAVRAGLSNKDAAIKAGYSAATASAAGSRLVKDKDVVAYLKRCAETTAPPPAPSAVGNSPSGTFDVAAALMHTDPKAYLVAAMNDLNLEPRLRIDAARALMPFTHAKKGEGGKKDEKAVAAEKANSGRFGAPPAPPRLIVGGKK